VDVLLQPAAETSTNLAGSSDTLGGPPYKGQPAAVGAVDLPPCNLREIVQLLLLLLLLFAAAAGAWL
jgi:hypothetical protein